MCPARSNGFYSESISITAMHCILHHLVDASVYQSEKPYELWLPTAPEIPRTNCIFEPYEVLLTNVRSTPEQKPSIEKEGFCYIEHCSRYADDILNHTGEQGSQIISRYLEEAAELVRTHLRADIVFVNDWRVSEFAFGIRIVI